MRTTKKQQYLNGLAHDIKFLQKEIQKNVFPFWFQGDRYSKFFAQKLLSELFAEQTKIAFEPDYKPWKEENKITAPSVCKLVKSKMTDVYA